MSDQVPFNRSDILGNELNYIQQAVSSKKLSGDGMFTKKCNEFFESQIGTKKALLTTSCTHALEMTAFLLNIKPEDEVIIPAFTFVSTVNAYVIRGAKPRFIDIRPDTLNLDESQLKSLITHRTKAIVPVHYAGVGCEMDAILGIANQHGIPVVEDNAHGIFGKYQGKSLGTFGVFSALSFHETKNFSCGEGGALLINDPKYIERAEVLREKGTNRSRFFRGQVDKYSWVDIGSSYLPSELNAAFLFAQLELKDRIQFRRKEIWEYYYHGLGEWADQNKVTLPKVPDNCDQSYHMFYLIMPNLEKRQELISYLNARGIAAVFHYLPLHLTEMGLRLGGRKGTHPVTEDISDRLVRLPFYNSFTKEDQKKVIEAILGFDL